MEDYKEILVSNIAIREEHKRKVQERLENELTKAPEHRDKELIADLIADCEYITADIKRYDKERIALEGLFFLFYLFFSFFCAFFFFSIYFILLYYLDKMLVFFSKKQRILNLIFFFFPTIDKITSLMTVIFSPDYRNLGFGLFHQKVE